MGKRLIDDDLPQSRPSDYRHDGKCIHYTRKYVDYPHEPKRGDRIAYSCVDCGKQKVLTI